MRRDDVERHIGRMVVINRYGDLTMTHKKYIGKKGKIKKLTRGGLVDVLLNEKGTFVTVPPKKHNTYRRRGDVYEQERR